MKRQRFEAWKRAAYTCALTAGLFPAAGAIAAPFSWTGTTSGNWSVGTNWGGTAPTSNAANDITFNVNAGTTNNQNNTGPFVVNSITFGSSAGTFTISGNQIRFGGATSALTHNDNSTQTFSAALDFNTATTIGGTGTGALVLSGVLSGAGAVTLNRNATLGNAANTFSGGLTVGPNVTITLTADSNVLGSGTLKFANNSSVVMVASTDISTGLLSTSGDGTGVSFSMPGNNVQNTITISGTTTETYAGVFNDASHSGKRINLIKEGTGTQILTGNSTSFRGTIDINGGTLAAGHASALGTGTISFGGGTLRWDSITTDFSGRFSGVNNQAIKLNTNGNNVTLASAITGTGSSLSKTGAGQLTLSGANANTVSALIDQGTLLLNKTAGVNAVAGSLTISGTGTVKLNAANQIADSTAVAISAGTFDLNSLSETIGSLNFSGGSITNVVAGGLSLAGTGTALTLADVSTTGFKVNLTGGSGGGVTYTAGTSGATIGALDTGSATRTINVGNGSASVDLVLSGALAGTGGITFNGGAGTSQFSGSSSNAVGLVTVTQGALELNKTAGDAIGANGLAVNGGTVKFLASDQINNAAPVTISSGTVDLNSNSDTVAVLSNSGALQNGTLTVTGNVTSNTGATYSSANLTMAPAAAVTTQLLGTAGSISGIGTFAVNGASNGAVNLNSKSLSVDTFTLNNGTVSSGTVTAATAINVEAGTVSATLNGAAGLTKSTAGVVTLNGNHAYTGNTVITGGTLQLGNSDAIDNGSKVVLNGGTLSTQGHDDIFNTIQLTENSIIDMGSGDSVLLFEESFAEAWTAGKTLTIINYTNNLEGTGVDRIYVGTAINGLTLSQMNQISFLNPDGFAPGTYGAMMLSDGQIVVPEPASLSLIALGGTALLMRRRRKA